MALRLIIGKNPQSFPQDGLKILHQSNHWSLQGSSEVEVIPSGNGIYFLWGDVLHAGTANSEIKRQAPEVLRNTLEGRFVLIFIEGESCRLFTDRFGQMDVYYQEVAGPFVFATDLSLLPLDKKGLQYDPAALVHTLCVYGYRPPKQHTLYKNIHRLGVDQEVQIEKDKVAIKEIPFYPEPLQHAFSERELHQYTDILLSAVELRGSPDGNVVSLSSGWDSTALLACLVKIFGAKKVRGVIGRMIYSERSGVVNQFELDRAKAIADYFKVRLDVVDFDYRNGAVERFARIGPWLKAHQLNSFAGLSVALLTEFVANTASGRETLFTGEISDGAHNFGFSQYSTFFHPSQSFREYSDKMASYLFSPSFFALFESNQFSSDIVYQIFRKHFEHQLFDEANPDPLLRRRQFLSSFFMRSNRIPLWSLANSQMLTPEGCAGYAEAMESRYLAKAASALNQETLYAWLLHLYNSFHWQSSPVAQRAIIAKHYGLQMAIPFWDSRLQGFLAVMPEQGGRGLDLNPTKFPLKWMLKNRVDYPYFLQEGPHSYLSDVDPRFSHSIEILYASSFAPHFRQLFRERKYHPLLSPSFFNLTYLDRLVDRYLSGEEVRGVELSELLSLASLSLVGWYE